MWKFDNRVFNEPYECVDYAREHLSTYSDTDQEDYINENYTACDIVQMVYDAMNDAVDKDPYGIRDRVSGAVCQVLDELYLEAESDFFEKNASNSEPQEGSDWTFDSSVFVWVDDYEEEDE